MSNPNTQNDFSKGSIVKNIMNLAIPMTLAQLINVLYNIVDRIYIGRIPDHATLSLTGIGLSLPIITLVIAFANLFGMGGAPLCSIERGRGDIKEAEAMLGGRKTVICEFLGTGMISVMPVLLLSVHPRECSQQGHIRYVPSVCVFCRTCPVPPHKQPLQAL